MPKTIKTQDHCLVPKHILLTKEEAQALFQKYNITPSQMPMISVKDQAIKNLHIEVGDVIKIIRNSPTEKDAVFYRIVRAD
ncbi:DNA-directed RNA polymerase subunit H [Candidatus Woesearchaeota archaeon]|nr:DNA-directed RNA polymerase subunit H [Candidatus Woesearchaeota archaeon]